MTLRRLKTTCDITRQSATRSNAGGLTSAVKVVATTYCDVERLLQRERIGASQVGRDVTDVFYYCALPRAVDVRNSDRGWVPGLLSKWQASHAYSSGDVIVPNSELGDGHCYTCIASGTSGVTEPARSQRRASRHTDGTATWQEAGRAFVLEVVGEDDKKSSPSAVIYQCAEIR